VFTGDAYAFAPVGRRACAIDDIIPSPPPTRRDEM